MSLDPSNFITTEIHSREVRLGDGQDHTLYFRELPNTDLKRYAMWQTSEDEDERAGAEARLLALGLVDANGEPALKFADACRLKAPIMRRLVTALLDVNGYKVPRAPVVSIRDGDDEADDLGEDPEADSPGKG